LKFLPKCKHEGFIKESGILFEEYNEEEKKDDGKQKFVNNFCF
jgi:hypothetical protein